MTETLLSATQLFLAEHWLDLALYLIPAGFATGLAVLFWRMIRSLGFFVRLLRSGVRNFYLNRDEYRTCRKEKNIDQFILSAEHSVLYVGFYFAAGTDNAKIDDAIRELLHRGARVELVLLHHGTEPAVISALGQYFGVLGHFQDRLRDAYEHFSALKEGIDPRHRDEFILKRHKKLLTSSALLLDRDHDRARALFDFKIAGLGRDRSFGIEFLGRPKPGSLYSRLVASFDEAKRSAE